MKNRLVMITLALLVVFGVSAVAQDGPRIIRFPQDTLALEFVGNVINPAGTPNSNQFGYFAFVDGLNAFTGTPEDAAHANFTFYTEAVTKRVTNNGTLRIVDREATTTVYLATSAPSFADPNSFKSGIPIQVSTVLQQVILDTTTGDFSAVNTNTVTTSQPFNFEGEQVQLGQPGDRFRTLLRGKTNGTPPPGFFMAGYAIGMPRSTSNGSTSRHDCGNGGNGGTAQCTSPLLP